MMQTICRQRGLSIVELMIGVTLSLLLILGVTQVFLSSKTTYTSNHALSDIQERGRFAVEMVSRDIRNAGYKGQCLGAPLIHLAGGATSVWALNDAPVHGWAGTKPPFSSKAVVSGTDSLLIQYAVGGTDVVGVAGNIANSDTISLGTGRSPVAEGGVALISDGLACDVFVNKSSASDALVRDSAFDWTHDYTGEFEVLQLETLAYYVALQEGVPTLFRARFSPDFSVEQAEALIPHVNSLSLEYGVAAGGVVADYVPAGSVTNWGNVASVKVILEVQGAPDVKKKFSTTVALRNNLP